MPTLTKEDWENYKKSVEESIKKMTMALKENVVLLRMAEEEIKNKK